MAQKNKIKMIVQAARADLAAKGGAWLPDRLVMLNVPPTQPAEAFSSWFWRAALRSGLSLNQLSKLWELPGKSHLLDVRLLEFDHKVVLSKLNGIAESDMDATLWRRGSPVSLRQGLWLTLDLLSEKPIYKYCPICLAGDKEPYFRKGWRQAFSFICTEHGELLRDRCSACNSEINLSVRGKFAKDNWNRSLTLKHCQACGIDLSLVKREKPNAYLMNILWPFQLKMAFHLRDATDSYNSQAESNLSDREMFSYRWQPDFGNTLHDVFIESLSRNQNLGIDAEKAFGDYSMSLEKIMRDSHRHFGSLFYGVASQRKTLDREAFLKLSAFIGKFV